MKTSQILRREDIEIDLHQGNHEDDERAFGFIGARGSDDVQGYFFTWPGPEPTCSVSEIERVINTLDLDTAVGSALGGTIPLQWAAEALRRELRAQARKTC